MAQIEPATLEQRLAILEDELWKANGRIKVFEERLRRIVRMCVAVAGGLTAFLLVCSLVVPAPGTVSGTTLRAPVVVLGSAGTRLIELHETAHGGAARFYSSRGGNYLAAIGVSDAYDAGGAYFTTSGKTGEVSLGATNGGAPYLDLHYKDKVLASLTELSGEGYITLYNSQGKVVAFLGGDPDSEGALELSNVRGNLSVKAGTNPSGHGYVAAGTNGVIRVEAKPFNPSVLIGP